MSDKNENASDAKPDQVDTHTVAKTGDKIETTDVHDKAGTPAEHVERTEIEHKAE